MLPTQPLKPWTLSSLVLGLSFLFGGCAPTPEKVSINFDKISLEEVESFVEQNPEIAYNGTITATRSVLPGEPSKNLIEGRAQTLSEEAMLELRKNRQTAFERVLSSLESAYLGQARLEQRQGNDELVALAEKEWELLTDLLRGEFEDHANKRGPLIMDLSGIVGFPDDGRRPRRPIGNDLFTDIRIAKAERLRTEIKELDLSFSQSIQSQVGILSSSILKRTAAFESSVSVRRNQLLAEAKEEAERRVQTSLNTLPDEAALLEEHVAALIAVTSSRGESKPVRSPVDGGQSTNTRQTTPITKLAQMFAASRGYKLVPSGTKARDVTQEMKVWLKTHKLGR